MNIFIYGNQNFKKEIQKILTNSKIETILEDIKIEDLPNIDSLKEKITINPNDIFLIDEDKIIKKSKFKFLKQKDGIEEDFLLQYGVNDLSIDKLDEIPNYIIKKYEKKAIEIKDKSLEIKNEDLLLDNELASFLESKEQENSKNINNSILEEPVGININELDNLIEVDTTKEFEMPKDDSKIISNLEDFDDNFGLNNVSFDYDDDSILNDDSKSDEDLLQDILNAAINDEDDYEFVGETFEDTNFLDEIFPNISIISENENSVAPRNIVLQDDDKNIDFKEDSCNLDLVETFEGFDFDKNFEDIQYNKDENIAIIDNLKEETIEEDLKEKDVEIVNSNDLESKEEVTSKKGEDMNDEFLELDSLNEQDLIEALGGSDISNSQITTQNKIEPQQIQSSNSNIDISSSNVDDIANLISKLLNNKTLEITIKIKD
ncbi:hypothetical protein CRU87_01715 [Aliarcobacter trophiarum LMG 25534]|uniref:Uncharacterized protein n=1 Tax=Aliarcobacter trophiarum LMG 25534 TaxID=1032241 RepID=A0AAD0VLC7_9BACT|nr:hypothetical protein [Aliarcobacter trophiarum]AXK48093.1 hypothetical protein ATR_0200 [Aliarcobacter trophiarum LMG 25534]RXJ93228.1 hypothetical protein CRU87_01715 [Aliarcobacter trophiarum LMG 25534]